MEIFGLSRRGTYKDLINKKIGTLIVRVIYPAILSHCYHKVGKEEAIRLLYKLGEDIMDEYLKTKILKWDKKDFQGYVKDFLKFFYNSKGKIKKVNENLYHIIDDNCILCTDVKVEGLPFHYCLPYAGSINKLLKILVEREKIPKMKFYVDTIYSKSNEDPYCVHAIRLEEE
ncbi:MAG: hypothetical protein EAX96_19780 [Candidatus Lokiarchaeota archaeon]|nr:hypothetical protein [Candidatus Lokiarchaeota archaeon]